ncbi:MAG: hypothetical protein CME65_15925 [Halobacteriovoraceae bacterium]|nr:hypothetical protein [Halobacteriovoraceae bacterium]|tara:strand:- start:19803 stop:20363 length:561 start_codon:yes stop_codon:yes gene_type:complete
MKIILMLPLLILVSCGAEIIDQEENTEDNPQAVTLTRKQQRTIRYDCEGQVTSDRVETTNSVSKRMRIDPKDPTGIWSFRASMSGDSAGQVQGNSGYFTIDMAPTVFNLQIYEGMNQINYLFRHCYNIQTRTEVDDEGNEYDVRYCADDVVDGESGTIYIDVTYVVERAETPREVRKTPEQCSESP